MAPPGKITMTDIAKRANVNQSTVSLALRNSPQISEKTKVRIKALADEMGYAPNPFVSALIQSRKSRYENTGLTTIAYLSFEALSSTLREEHLFHEFERGATLEAMKHGFKLEKMKVTADMSVSRLNQIIKARGIIGVVCSPLPGNMSRIKMDWEQFSAIAIGPTLKEPVLHRVMSNHYENMSMLFQYCCERGYKRIGFCLRKTPNERIGGVWEGSFLRAQGQYELARKIPVLALREWSKHEFLEWIEKYSPDMVIGLRANRLLSCLKTAGYRVPEDIGVATVSSAQDGGELTGIVEDGVMIAQQAVTQLVRMILSNELGVPENPLKILANSRINIGTTTL